MKSKKIIVPVIALCVLSLVSFLGVRSVRADENSAYPSIVQKLVERFNLNTEEVQQVFDEVRNERRQQMQAHFEERLEQAVSDGKITKEQKQAILAKKGEMETNRGGLNKDLLSEGLAPKERREEMESHRQEMKAWAEENGIDLDFLPMLLGKGYRGGFGGPRFGR